MDGQVAALWRYPVSSLGGEPLETCAVDATGLVGDREWGPGRPGQRRDRLPGEQAPLAPGAANSKPATPPTDLSSISPDGLSLPAKAAGDALAAYFGFPVPVRPHASDAAETATGGAAEAALWAPPDPYPGHRFAGGAAGDPAGRRPSMCAGSGRTWCSTCPTLEGFAETGWIGRLVAIGEVRIRIVDPCVRCAFTTLAQGDLLLDPALLMAVAKRNATHLGVLCTVEAPGEIRVGDAARVLDQSSKRARSAPPHLTLDHLGAEFERGDVREFRKAVLSWRRPAPRWLYGLPRRLVEGHEIVAREPHRLDTLRGAFDLMPGRNDLRLARRDRVERLDPGDAGLECCRIRHPDMDAEIDEHAAEHGLQARDPRDSAGRACQAPRTISMRWPSTSSEETSDATGITTSVSDCGPVVPTLRAPDLEACRFDIRLDRLDRHGLGDHLCGRKRVHDRAQAEIIIRIAAGDEDGGEPLARRLDRLGEPGVRLIG